MAPLIIHQTHACAEAGLPRLLASLRRTVVELNPQAEHRFWSDADLEALLARSYPGLLPAFRSARVGVQRSDLGRLAVLHSLGGLYLDTDVECLRAFGQPLVGGPRLAVAPEPQAQVDALYGGGQYLCNAVLYAPAGDAFLASCLARAEEMWAAQGPAMWARFDVLGGRLLSEVRQRRPDLPLDVVPAATCYPMNDLKLTDLPSHAADREAARLGRFGPDAQAVHWWLHTNFEGRAAVARHDRAWPCLAELYGLSSA